jgi:hypothetical protein
VIDDFHDRSSLAQWQFSNGAEFPGAAGSLTLGQGHSGPGATLRFQINCDSTRNACGHYVAAYRTISPPSRTQFHALSLWVCLPPEMKLVVRVRDESGQTLQYYPNAPTLEYHGPNTWTPVLVSLDAAPDGSWGGRNNGHLNGSITQIGILADSRNPVPFRGSLGFDDISLRESLATTLDLSRSTHVLSLPVSSASLSARLGVNVHSVSDEAGLDAAHSAGFSFVRTDLLWATVEKQGHYDFSAYDRLLSSLERRGMKALWILDYGHPNHGGSQPHTAADIAAYARYAQAAAAHFKGRNVRYEIWNEPNLSSFLPDSRIFPELLGQATKAMRQADASATISVGGVSGVDLPFLDHAALIAPARETDAIAIHPYRSTGPETLVPDFLLLRRFVDAKIRPSLPIWDTEWGYSSSGFFSAATYGDGHTAARQRQAVLAVRHILTVWALGFPVAVWYDLRDDGNDAADRESNFGLLDTSGQEKTSLRAVRVLTAAARQHSLAGILADAPAGVHALKLAGDADFTWIVWCDQPGDVFQIRFPAGELQAAFDMLGQKIPVRWSAAKAASVTITEADGPVYLRFRRSPLSTHQSLRTRPK